MIKRTVTTQLAFRAWQILPSEERQSLLAAFSTLLSWQDCFGFDLVFFWFACLGVFWWWVLFVCLFYFVVTWMHFKLLKRSDCSSWEDSEGSEVGTSFPNGSMNDLVRWLSSVWNFSRAEIVPSELKLVFCFLWKSRMLNHSFLPYYWAIKVG